MTSIFGVCGNPSPGSKTLSVTEDVVAALASGLGVSDTRIVDLSGFGGKVLAWGDPEVGEARAAVKAADIVVVSTPVYKGAYTGLLKGFLDGYDQGDWTPGLALPLTIAASPAHALAGPTHLEPVLAELGALMPGGTLHVPDKVAADLEARAAHLAAWLEPRLALFATAVTP